MPFTRPTIAQLIARTKSDIETRLPGADARIRRSVEAVLSRVNAGGSHSLHGHLVWLSKQLFPDTAEDEFLVRWATIWGLERTEAVKASGTLAITGVNTTICPDETLWQTADEVIYEQDGAVTITAGVAAPDVVAVVGGTDGNQDAGATLSLVTPITGIDSDGAVDGSGLTGGIDEETDAALLIRLLLRLQSPPKGGGPGDYVFWALEVAGTTRAWQYPLVDGGGTVAVRFVMDNKAITLIPDAGEVATVQAYIDTKAPVTAEVTVIAPVATATAFTISITPDTAAIRTAVEAELDDLYLREAEPGGTIYLSQINEAISLAEGETDHTLTVPAADVTHTANQMPTVGTITWV